MLTIAVANPKGGTGKSTVACHLAAAFSHQGPTVMVDLDRQRCASAFVRRRPRNLPAVRLCTDVADAQGRYAVLDLPAGNRGLVDAIVPHADAIVVPVTASTFDEIGLSMFLDRLRDHEAIARAHTPVFVVANRVRGGSRTETELLTFLGGLAVPLVAALHDRQDFALGTRRGVTCYDGPASQGRPCRDDLAPLISALRAVRAAKSLDRIERFPNNNRKLVAG